MARQRQQSEENDQSEGGKSTQNKELMNNKYSNAYDDTIALTSTEGEYKNLSKNLSRKQNRVKSP